MNEANTRILDAHLRALRPDQFNYASCARHHRDCGCVAWHIGVHLGCDTRDSPSVFTEKAIEAFLGVKNNEACRLFTGNMGSGQRGIDSARAELHALANDHGITLDAPVDAMPASLRATLDALTRDARLAESAQ